VSGRGDGGGAAVFLNTDASVWATSLTSGRTLHYAPDDDRQLLLYVLAGVVLVNGIRVGIEEQLRLAPAAPLTVYASEAATVLLVDVSADRGN
jgi:redox-sensitive bicupin YhaK (pirin superfamily)